MDEILALQQQLAQLQETTTKNRLSDRIMVDLIEKLVREFDLKVYHTTDGQSLITPKQLSKTIAEIVQQQSRISLLELPNLIGVSIDKIEAQIEKDCGSWSITRVSDELFSNQYIHEICEEINEELQQKQELGLIEIMQKFKIPSQFLKLSILPQVGTLIQGVISDDKLTTNTYQATQLAKLRGALRAKFTPVPFVSLQKDFGIENSQKLCEQLIQSSQLEGKIISGQFYSFKFLEHQEQVTRKFFEQNFYVEYDLLQKQLLVGKPKEYLKSLFKDSVIFLDTCGMNKNALQFKREQILETLSTEGFTNLQDILPTSLSDNDMETLFQMLKIEDVEVEDFLIYSKAFLEKLAASFKEKMVNLICQNPQSLIAQQPVQQEEDIQASAGGFADRKKKQGKKPQKQAKAKETCIFSQKEVFDHLIGTKQVDYDDCHDILYRFLSPRLQGLYESVKVELFENKKSASATFIQNLSQQIQEITLGLLITQRSLAKVLDQSQEVDSKILVDNCLFGYRLLVENIVVLTCKKFNIQLPQNYLNDSRLQPSLGQSQQQQQGNLQNATINCGMQQASKYFKNKNCLMEAIQYLPKDQMKCLKEVMDLYGKKQLGEIAKHKFLEEFNIRVSLEKKSDKNFLYFVIHHAKEKIRNELKVDNNQEVFDQIVVAALAELGYFFVGNYDQKFMGLLVQICAEMVENKEVKQLLQLIPNLFQQSLETKAEILELLALTKLA